MKFMGKKSVRENKSIFQLAREEACMTRAQASEAMDFISESRIEKYESGKSEVHPEEVLVMAQAYGKPELCNYYCSKMCPIGMVNVSEVQIRDLSQIVLRTLATLQSLEKEKDRFIEITADSEISDDEMTDFVRIQNGIQQIAELSDSLKLWVSRMIATKQIDEERLQQVRNSCENKKESARSEK